MLCAHEAPAHLAQTAILQSHYESRLAIRTFLATRAKMFTTSSNVEKYLSPGADAMGRLFEAIAVRMEMQNPAEEEPLIRSVGVATWVERGAGAQCVPGGRGRQRWWRPAGSSPMGVLRCDWTRAAWTQGESAAGLFIVVKGFCSCYIDSPGERDGLKLVKVVQVGDHFGELSLLEPGSGARAHVHAGPSTRVALLSPSAFEQARGAPSGRSAVGTRSSSGDRDR